jgi:nucleoside-diphosphate-sugar epimerase
VRILVTGTEGYIGSLLGPLLVRRGHDVVGLDTGFYTRRPLYEPSEDSPETIHQDVRTVTPDQLEGFDAVVHMAELSNDPLGELLADVTYDVNHRGSVILAEAARTAGVPRFVYTSSCSVYGIATEDLVDEESPLRPQTAYARCKELVERDVGAMAGDDFSPTFLRNATAYGASPRMRFDIVLNNLAGHAWTSGVVRLQSDGSPWRPLVHAEDISRAVIATVEAPRERVHGQVLNVGAPGANYRVRELAEIVASTFPGSDLSIGPDGGDNRSYRVSFDKIAELLPEFVPAWDVAAGARELHDVFDRVQLTLDQFEGPDFIRLRRIEELRSGGRLDESLYWSEAGEAS